MRKVHLLLAASFMALPTIAQADGRNPTSVTPVLLTTQTYAQNFDSLATSGTSNTALPAGFQIFERGDGVAADGIYATGTGSSNAGNTYSFGVAGGADRALGSLASGSVSEILFGALFTNQLPGTITGLNFQYSGEQWRAGNSTDDRLTFEFSTNASQIDNGTWTEFSALNFSPIILTGDTALNGNLTGNIRSISGLISGLSIAHGSNFGFRFRDINATGNDHGLAVDNLSFTAALAPVSAIPEPSTWALMLLGFGAIGASMRRRQVRRFA